MKLDSYLLNIMPKRLQEAMTKFLTNEKTSIIQTIRLREDKPVIILLNSDAFMLCEDGSLCQDTKTAMKIGADEIDNLISHATQGSLYAVQDQICGGYLSLPGGHRLGLCGEVILQDGILKNMKNIRFLNLRLANQVKGSANRVLPHIISDDARPYNTLIIGPPCSGKTTILRDLIRQISNGNLHSLKTSLQIAIADERFEIAGSYCGVSQLDVGICTDVISGCPKAQAMRMLIRAMSPDVIATDEIGADEDASAVKDAGRCGISLIATAHGRDLDELTKRPSVQEMLSNKTFQRLIILSRRSGVGTVEKVLDLTKADHKVTVSR